MRDWCWLHVSRLHPCSVEAPEQRSYVQRDDHVHCVVVASHYSENALHRYSGPNKSSEPSLDSGRHHVGIGCVAEAAEGGGHRHQNVPREGQIPAVVRPRLPVAGKRRREVGDVQLRGPGTPGSVIRNNMSLVFGWSLTMFGLLGRQCFAEPGRVVDIYVRKRRVLPMPIIIPHRCIMFTA
jgi:hypothetical protein